MTEKKDRIYLHVDLDAFFASVEQHDHPEYRGKPVIVGGLPEDRRSVVSTASYEARKYGVHSALPVALASRLCPNGIFLRGNYKRYSEISHCIMEIFRNYSPDVTQMSIDEAFIDITGTERLFGTPQETARKIKNEVLEKTGLTVSIGIACTKYVAKIASGYRKPDGITFVPKGKEEDFMLSLPLEKLWGVGTKTLSRLKSAGFFTMKDIHSKSKGLLVAIFGDCMGTFLYNAVRGNRELDFGGDAKNRSISEEHTFEYDITDRYAVDTALMELSNHIHWKMMKENIRARTIVLKVRYEDFCTVTVRETYEVPFMNADDFFERCRTLFSKKVEFEKSIRLLGVGVSSIEANEKPLQKELFDFGNEKKSKVEKAIFEMEKKNPRLKMKKARILLNSD